MPRPPRLVFPVLLVALLAGAVAAASPAHAQSSDGSAVVERLLAASQPPGTLGGWPARYHIERGGRGAGRTSYGVILVDMGDQGLLLQVRRRAASDADDARAGRTAGVTLGDPAFDAAYTVEGAPSDLVRALLDDELRAALLGIDRVIVDVDERWAEFSIGGTPRTEDEARRFVAIASRVAERLRAGLVPPAGSALSPQARAAELAQLRALRARRREANIPFVIAMGVVGLVVIGLLVRNMSRRRR